MRCSDEDRRCWTVSVLYIDSQAGAQRRYMRGETFGLSLHLNSELTFRRQRTRMIYSSRGRMQSIATRTPLFFRLLWGTNHTHHSHTLTRTLNHVQEQVCAPHTFHTPQPQTAARPHTRDTLRNTRDLARDLAAAVRSTRALCAPSANRSYLLHHAPHGQLLCASPPNGALSRERERPPNVRTTPTLDDSR
jgi:hypothetical protein